MPSRSQRVDAAKRSSLGHFFIVCKRNFHRLQMNKAAPVKSVADRAWAAAQWPDPPDEQENDRDQQGGENRPAVKYVDIAHQRRLIGYNVTDIAKGACLRAGRRAKLGEVLRQIVHRRLESRRRLR